MKEEFLQLLKQLGLNSTQSLICYHLISGSKNIKELILLTNLARSTLVESLLVLEDLQVVKSTYSSKVKLYSLISSNVFNLLTDSKISQLSELQQHLFESKEQISKFISLSTNKIGIGSNIQLYIGKKEISNLYRSTVVEKEIYSICRLDEYYKLFPGGLMVQSQANRQKKHRLFRDLLIEGASLENLKNNTSNLDYSNYEYKIIKDSLVLKENQFTDIMICKDYVIFSNFKSQIPYSYKLNSTEIAGFMKGFHNILWELLS